MHLKTVLTYSKFKRFTDVELVSYKIDLKFYVKTPIGYLRASEGTSSKPWRRTMATLLAGLAIWYFGHMFFETLIINLNKGE